MNMFSSSGKIFYGSRHDNQITNEAPVTVLEAPADVVLTSDPTSSTIMAANACVDDVDFTFVIDIWNTQDCAWLNRQNSAIRKDKYCIRGHVKGACQSPCIFCPCNSISIQGMQCIAAGSMLGGGYTKSSESLLFSN